MKQRIKSYKFWVALSGAVVIFVKALGQAFCFEISADVVDGIIMGFCGVLVAMGLVEKPTQKTKTQDVVQSESNENKFQEQNQTLSQTQNKE